MLRRCRSRRQRISAKKTSSASSSARGSRTSSPQINGPGQTASARSPRGSGVRKTFNTAAADTAAAKQDVQPRRTAARKDKQVEAEAVERHGCVCTAGNTRLVATSSLTLVLLFSISVKGTPLMTMLRFRPAGGGVAQLDSDQPRFQRECGFESFC